MHVHMPVYTKGGGGSLEGLGRGGDDDGQHSLVLVWGLDQGRVIITDPLLCFRDPPPAREF